MAVAELIAKLTSRGREAEQTFDALAVKAVEGDPPTEKQVESACRAAGKSLAAFAVRLEVLEKRKAAFDAYHNGRWEEERTRLKAEGKQLREQFDELKAEIEALTAESQSLAERLRVSSSQLSRLGESQEAARRELRDTLHSTGGGETWQSFASEEEGADE